MIIIGIDPGAKGGVAIFDEETDKMTLYKCPDTPKEMASIINTAKLNQWDETNFLPCRPNFVYLSFVQYLLLIYTLLDLPS